MNSQLAQKEFPPFKTYKLFEVIPVHLSSEIPSINPYVVHFGNIQERHLWKKKSKIYFLISDDVIHGRFFMTSHKSETTPVRLPLCHMT